VLVVLVVGNIVPMRKRETDKFKYHTFICDKCDFNTQNPKSPFDFIKNSDEVAAYNIAKIQLNYNGGLHSNF